MKAIIGRWLLPMMGVAFLMGSAGLCADEQKGLPKGMTPEKLERSVNKTLRYIDKRLLSGKSAGKIEASGSAEAVALLRRSREERDKIAEQIDRGQYEEAYWALKELNKSLKKAMRLSRAKERAAREAGNRLESARAISDAYYERARKRGIGRGAGGDEAFALYRQAEQRRIQARSLEGDEDPVSAAAAYEGSTELLQKAIALARKQGGGRIGKARPTTVAAEEAPPVEAPPERRPLPKGMTPEKLERSVNKTFRYVDKRLLSGKSAGRIEASGSAEAIALLQRSREERDKIAQQIERGQHEEAYWALKELNKSIKEAMRLSRAKERAARKAGK
ncbi:MAG TPA: hypothetical protein ENI99_03400 [Sedimenticola sp.]|nr:hypothetical protein [Sedimenticola sp.]